MDKIYAVMKSFFPWITVLDIWLIIFGILIVVFVMAFYVYNDAKVRGSKSLNWFIATILLGGVIPFIFYLMIRSPYTLDEIREEETKKEVLDLQKRYYELMIDGVLAKCPVCGEEVKNDYMYCPHCFTQLKKRCSNCGALVDKDAKICPYCGHIFEEKEKE